MPMGVYVNEVVAGSCAEQAGMQPKDIITQVGGHRVESVNDLSRGLRQFEAGDTVEVVVYRAGAETKLSVTLDEKPREEQRTELPHDAQSSQEDWMEGLFPGVG